MKKEATLNIKLSQELYDVIKVEAENHKVSMAAYVRAVLAKQIFGKQTSDVLGLEYLVITKDGGLILDL